MKCIIVGIDKNNAIGSDHDMPWKRDMKDDLAFFTKTSMGGSVIAGRNTFEHDFRGKPLKGRETIIVTGRPLKVEGVLSANSLEAAYELARYPIFVAGGGKIYASAINDMDRLYVNQINAEFPDAEVFFPKIDTSIWKETFRRHHPADERNKYAFDYVTYDRIDVTLGS